MKTTRRSFLTGVGTAALTSASFGTIAGALGGFGQAHAADTSGYKALVCLFLFGGLDGHDVLIPYDATSYNDFATIRRDLINAANGSRDRANLLALNPTNQSDFGARQFALPPEMSGIKGLFDAGDAAIMANVGPLVQPVTRTQWENETAIVPPRLFSHNDQQAIWQSSEPEGAGAGWGGLFADAMAAARANTVPDFTTITTSGNELFLTGEEVLPYQISPWGAGELDILNWLDGDRWHPEGEAVYQAMRSHLRAGDPRSQNLIHRDVATALRHGFDTNELFSEAREGAPTLTTTFPESWLGDLLRTVAETIAIREALGASRQIYFVGIGGFDTHSAQAGALPQLLGEIDGAVTAFHSSMVAQGLQNDVTLFTASDFGRTLAVNGDGTDHGWGGHQLVVGGAVNGNTIHGQVPPPTFDHGQDSGQGRLIPTTAVEQMAASLGSWFGLSQAELNVALPNLGNFTGRPGLLV